MTDIKWHYSLCTMPPLGNLSWEFKKDFRQCAHEASNEHYSMDMDWTPAHMFLTWLHSNNCDQGTQGNQHFFCVPFGL